MICKQSVNWDRKILPVLEIEYSQRAAAIHGDARCEAAGLWGMKNTAAKAAVFSAV